LTISCGDSSEHEGPDSGKLLFQFSLWITFVLIDDSVFLFFFPAYFAPVPTQPNPTSLIVFVFLHSQMLKYLKSFIFIIFFCLIGWRFFVFL
jgi:hypothetical protein